VQMVRVQIEGVLDITAHSNKFATFKDVEIWYQREFCLDKPIEAANIVDKCNGRRMTRAGDGHVNDVPVACSLTMGKHRIKITRNEMGERPFEQDKAWHMGPTGHWTEAKFEEFTTSALFLIHKVTQQLYIIAVDSTDMPLKLSAKITKATGFQRFGLSIDPTVPKRMPAGALCIGQSAPNNPEHEEIARQKYPHLKVVPNSTVYFRDRKQFAHGTNEICQNS